MDGLERTAKIYLVAGLFDLDLTHWRWQLGIDGGGILSIRLPNGLALRVGPIGPPSPAPSCFRVGALMALAHGDEAEALIFMEKAGMGQNDLRETWSALQAEFREELDAIEKRLAKLKKWRKPGRPVAWPRDIRDIVEIGYQLYQS